MMLWVLFFCVFQIEKKMLQKTTNECFKKKIASAETD